MAMLISMQLQLILLLGAGLTQAEGQGLGVILGIGFVASVVSLVAAALGGFGERSVSGVKVSLVLACVCGLAFVLTQSFFAAGGVPQNIQVINGN
jgi:hypothetical protein